MGNIIEAIIYFILVLGVGIFAIKKWGITKDPYWKWIEFILDEISHNYWLCEFVNDKMKENPEWTYDDMIKWYEEWHRGEL